MKTDNITKLISFIISASIVFIFAFTFFKSCNPPQPEVTIIKDTIVIVEYKENLKVDTVIQNKYITRNVHDTIKVIVRDSIYIASEIISDFFAKVNYKDTLLNDSNGLITISDTIYMNRLLNRSTVLNLINTTKIIQDNKAHLYFGLGTAINDNINLSVNGYLQKKRHLIGLGYNTQKQIMLNYSYKIR